LDRQIELTEEAMIIREYTMGDLKQMIMIWNEIVDEGIAFPQEDLLDEQSGKQFFESQSYCGVAVDENNKVLGLYILHPNNVGRCGHICNASYAVSSLCIGQHIGEKLVMDCIQKAKEIGFLILQFNAVVETNIHARHLYERLGFKQLGTIPKGFRMKDGYFENICPYYVTL
jgi:L-amino acid N-acyltransferase YncA